MWLCKLYYNWIGITKIKHYGVLCCTCVSLTGLLIWFGYNTFSSKILGSVFTFRGTFAYFHYIQSINRSFISVFIFSLFLWQLDCSNILSFVHMKPETRECVMLMIAIPISRTIKLLQKQLSFFYSLAPIAISVHNSHIWILNSILKRYVRVHKTLLDCLEKSYYYSTVYLEL